MRKTSLTPANRYNPALRRGVNFPLFLFTDLSSYDNLVAIMFNSSLRASIFLRERESLTAQAAAAIAEVQLTSCTVSVSTAVSCC